MKPQQTHLLNEYARLYIKGANKNGRPRYLACDPAYTDENWTWTTDIREANFFALDRLPEMLEYVRGRHGGYAVKLRTLEADCTLAEMKREPVRLPKV